MYSDGSALRQLTRDECLRLLATVPIGRIIYTRQALPAVELVNFALDGGDIVIRTDPSGKLAAAARGAIVAFEADSVEFEQRTGWSVTAIGPSSEVTDATDISRLRRIGLDTWAPGVREHFIRITPQLLNGRRLGSGRPALQLDGKA
jgi:nitroimidazol reductase NimA-like FMN-containing flavoprotein (pyridoxamine 5'-phosphate oxidase superfamily)